VTGSPPAVSTERPAEPSGAPPSPGRSGQRIGKRALVILLVIVTAGGAFRAWEAAHPYLARQSPDEVAYARLAVGLVDQQRYGDPRLDSLHWPPGAPAMFALGYALHRDPDLRLAYWLQALVGTLLIAVAFLLAWALAGEVAGLGAAALVAFYPPFIKTTGELLSEPLGALLLTSATLAVVLAWQHPRKRWPFALAGFLYALAIFTRADFVLMPAVVVALLAIAALHRKEPRLIARSAGIFALACGLALAPWVIYASARQGHAVLVTEGDASALFVGTYLPGGGTTYGMKRALGDRVRARYPEVRNVRNWDLPAPWVLKYVAARHPELPRDDAVRLEARRNLSRYALGQPLEFGHMMLQKMRRTWILSSRVGGERPNRAVRIGHGIFVGLAFILALVAFIRRRTLGMALLLATVLYSALLHAVFVAKPRYNLPPLPLLMAAGAAAAVLLWRERAALTRR
jgi:4-amino-4-deoxy-L-arabinose transferase-like glycosyltransferase